MIFCLMMQIRGIDNTTGTQIKPIYCTVIAVIYLGKQRRALLEVFLQLELQFNFNAYFVVLKKRPVDKLVTAIKCI